MVSPMLLWIQESQGSAKHVCPRYYREEKNGSDRREEEHIGIAVNDSMLEE